MTENNVEFMLNTLLPESNLDDLITSTSDLKVLRKLFRLKASHIQMNLGRKMYYPLHNLYFSDKEDINIICEVLKEALSVVENHVIHIEELAKFVNECINNLSSSNLLRPVKLLHELCTFCNSHKLEETISNNVKHENIIKMFSIILREKSNTVKVFVISFAIKSYFFSCTINHKLHLLSFLFNHGREIENLEALCLLLRFIDNDLLINTLSILYLNDYWIYLATCLSCRESYLQNQASYLLTKTSEILYENIDNIEKLPIYLKPNLISLKDMPEVWNNFFTLLDISKEKQLHLIQPSLKLIKELKYLHFLWEICVYKIFLNHFQNYVQIFVINHILSEKLEYIKLEIILPELLPAIIRGNLLYTKSTFLKLRQFSNNFLDQEKFNLLLKEALCLKWCPTSMWRFLCNILTQENRNLLQINIFENLYYLIKSLPHIFIRNGCLKILLTYFIQKNNINKFDDVSKILHILSDCDDIHFKQFTLNNHFIRNNIGIIKKAIVCDILQEFPELRRINILLKAMGILKENNFEIDLFNQVNNKNVLLVIYKYFFEIFDEKVILEYIIDNITLIKSEYVDDFMDLISHFIKINSEHVEKIKLQVIKLLTASFEECNMAPYVLAFEFVLLSQDSKLFYIVDIWKFRITSLNYKIDETICCNFIDLYFLKNVNTSNISESLGKEIIDIFENLLDKQSDQVVCKIFNKISPLIHTYNNCKEISRFLYICLRQLETLTKSRFFKSASKNLIQNTYVVSLFLNINYQSTLNEVNKTFLQLSETHNIISYLLADQVKALSLVLHVNKFSLLIPMLCKLSLQQVVVCDEDRIEYFVSQEVARILPENTNSSNWRCLHTRLYLLDAVLYILSRSKDSEFADELARQLMEIYRTNFNKRYFPESLVHFQKLRIMQLLLIMHQFLSKSKKAELVEDIKKSFCMEVHQPCVRQLMQWLLICLLENDSATLTSISNQINIADRCQPSSVTAFIPVLYHLTLHTPQEAWFRTVETILPWCMGAHFKLRVYSQVSIIKLCEQARSRNFRDFLNKYEILENSIKPLVKASYSQFNNVLKTDIEFFDFFKADKHYSIETIFVIIPKLNGVPSFEYENILQYTFVNQDILPVLNSDRAFSSHVHKEILKTESKHLAVGDEDDTFASTNLQKKITPWKTMFEEEDVHPVIGNFIIIASLVDRFANLGGISRSCEVFGVKQLVIDNVKVVNEKDFKNLSMTSENWLNIFEVKISDLSEFVLRIKEKGYTVIGVEQTSQSVKLNKYCFPKKSVLLLGNEKQGIPADLLPIVDVCVEIPQFGKVRSLNVHVASAIFTWEYVKQHLIAEKEVCEK